MLNASQETALGARMPGVLQEVWLQVAAAFSQFSDVAVYDLLFVSLQTGRKDCSWQQPSAIEFGWACRPYIAVVPVLLFVPILLCPNRLYGAVRA